MTAPADLRQNTWSAERRADDDAVLAVLRAVADGKPLSAKRYDRERPTDTLSTVRVQQRYGGWKPACEAAGVQPGGKGRGGYSRAWTSEQMLDVVREYLADPETPGSYAAFDAWCKARGTGPSAQTVRNVFGSWNGAKARALGLAAS